MTSPGRLEVVRRSPTIVLDAAHNPHGAEAAAAALEDSFEFSPLIGVIGVMADKDAEGLLAAFEPPSRTSSHPEHHDRAMPADELAATASEVFGEDRVTSRPAGRRDRRGDHARRGRDAFGDRSAAVGVLVTGSVVTVG